MVVLLRGALPSQDVSKPQARNLPVPKTPSQAIDFQ
jgi:hypothetical protein